MGKRRVVVLILNWQILYFMVILCCVAMGSWLLIQPTIWTNQPLSNIISGKTVVIDAGHGGSDPGAKSQSGLKEKGINLDIALKLKKYLSRVGVYCVMIRETDRDFYEANNDGSTFKIRDLLYRSQVANQSKADIFLSIHANSFPNPIYHGAQTFFDPHDRKSKKLAAAIQNELVHRLGPNKRHIKPGDFRVLHETRMPGVTIEVGFLSNLREAALLDDAQYRDKIAEAIFYGVVAYFCEDRLKK